MTNRRSFLKKSSALFAVSQSNLFLRFAQAADAHEAIAETTSGKVRGAVADDIKIFKGIPYGASTAGPNRFMPPVKPAAWTGVRDTLAWGHTAPQTTSARPGAPEEGED